MSVNHSHDEFKEQQALAQIALALSASSADHTQNIDSDDLIALSDGSLSPEKRIEIIRALNANPLAYQQWLNFCELQEIGRQLTQPEIKPSKEQIQSSGLFEQIKSWFGHWNPIPLGSAAAFGLVAGLAIGLNPVVNNSEPANQLTLSEGQKTPMKASQQFADFVKTPATEPALLLCSEANNNSLCASQTLGRQHWYLKQGKEYKALPTALVSDSINGINVSGDFRYAAITSENNEEVTLLVIDISDFTQGNLDIAYGYTVPHKETVSKIHWNNQILSFNTSNQEHSIDLEQRNN